MPLFSRCTLIALLSLLLLVLNGEACLAVTFYYFNPDSPQSNLSRLKGEMDKVLRHSDLDITFQPFARLHDFDRMVKQTSPAILFLPAWYLANEGDQLDLQPILRPLRHGQSEYNKVLLVANTSTWQASDLKDKTIAMTSMGQGGAELLNSLIFTRQGLDSRKLSIVTTAKDIDALFALALRQVDAALVSESNLAHIKKVNPRIASHVKVLAQTNPIAMPLLCVSKDINPADIRKLKDLFINQRAQAAKLLEMLQIDDWQDVTQ